MGFSSVLIGLSLSMDAFAVSLGSGISVKRIERRVQASQRAGRRFEGVARGSPIVRRTLALLGIPIDPVYRARNNRQPGRIFCAHHVLHPPSLSEGVNVSLINAFLL